MAINSRKPRPKEPKGRPNFIRQWRKHRGYTQETLAEMAHMSPGNLSMLENRQQDYTQTSLEALAEALQCAPFDLLMRDPSDPEGIWSIWEHAKPGERRQMVEVMKVIVGGRTGTDG